MPTADKNGDGRLRTDAEPLTKRFSALGRPERVSWMSGTMGDDRAPGPSTYWIDAAVWVTPDVAADLRATDPVDTGARPSLEQQVADTVPAGTPLTSSGLQAMFSSSSWTVLAFILDSADVVLLSAVGQ